MGPMKGGGGVAGLLGSLVSLLLTVKFGNTNLAALTFSDVSQP